MNDYSLKLPRTTGEIVDRYLSLLKVDEKYPAYSLDDKLNIISGNGVIKNNERYNNHKNEDISENELYFLYTDEYNCPRNLNRWWALSRAEAVNYQRINVEANIKELQDRIDTLKDKL